MTGADDGRTPDAEPERPVPPAAPAAGDGASSAATASTGAGAAVPPVPPAPGFPGSASSDAPPPAYSAAPPPRTAPIAIVAMVVAIFAPVIGLVLGIVALGRVKRTGEEGRGLAIASIVVGAALSVVILLTTLAIVVATIVGVSASTDPGTGSEPGVTALPPFGEEPTEPVPDGDDTDVFTLLVGDCLTGGEVEAEEVQSVPLVDCALPHDYEVFSEPVLTGDAFPGQEVVDGQADSLCFDAFAPYVGAAYESSALDFSYLTPTEGSWDAGDREVSCLLYDPAGPLTGSMQGSGL